MAVTYEEVLQLKKDKKINLPLMRKDLKMLPDIIDDDEELLLFILANTKPQGLLCLTDKRVLYVSAKLTMKSLTIGKNVGLESNSIPLELIQSVSSEQGVLYSTISINDGAKSYVFEKVTAPETLRFTKTLNDIRNTSNRDSKISDFSIADELIKYKNLLDQGVLTQTEFDTKKKELL